MSSKSFSINWDNMDQLVKSNVLTGVGWSSLYTINQHNPGLVSAVCGTPTLVVDIRPPMDDVDELKKVNPVMVRYAPGYEPRAPFNTYITHMKHFRPTRVELTMVRFSLEQLQSILELGAHDVKIYDCELTSMHTSLSDIVHVFKKIRNLYIGFHKLLTTSSDVVALANQLMANPYPEKMFVELSNVLPWQQNAVPPEVLNNDNMSISFIPRRRYYNQEGILV